MALGSWKVAVKGSPLLFFAGKSSPMQQLSRNVVLRCIATPRRRAGNGPTVTTKRCDLFSNSDVFQDTAGCSFLLVEQSSLGDSNSAGSIFCSFNFGQCNWLEDTLLEVYVRDLNVYVLSWRCLCGSTTLENLDVLNYDGLHGFYLKYSFNLRLQWHSLARKRAWRIIPSSRLAHSCMTGVFSSVCACVTVVVQVVIKGWEEQMGNRSENWQDFAGREWVRKRCSCWLEQGDTYYYCIHNKDTQIQDSSRYDVNGLKCPLLVQILVLVLGIVSYDFEKMMYKLR